MSGLGGIDWLMAREDAALYALAACEEYDRLMTEVRQFKYDMAGCICPNEPTWDSETGGAPGGPSCFKVASEEVFEADQWDDAPRRRNLVQIAAEVADCPSCSRLCELIAARKIARQQLGIARRKLRVAGKKSRRLALPNAPAEQP